MKLPKILSVVLLAQLSLLITAGCTTAGSKPQQRTPAAGGHSMDAHHGVYDEDTVFAACNKVGWTNRITPDQQKIVTEIFATRSHRVQHALWHAMRGTVKPEERAQIVKAYGPDADTEHPLCDFPGHDPKAADYSPVGEDFLYMHHQMVMILQDTFAKSGVACIKGWQDLKDAESFPPVGASETGPKSVSGFKYLQAMDEMYFQNEDWLRTVSLSEMGFALEISIHNALHVRYGSPLAKISVKGMVGNVQVPLDGVFPSDPKLWPFDDPAYDWMPDPYGSAVNPYFWKVHGYVDNVLQRWLEANKFHVAKVDCTGVNKCYKWLGTWVGPILPENQLKPSSDHIRSTAEIKAMNEFNKRRMKQQFNLPKFPINNTPVTPEDPLAKAKTTIKCP